MKHVVQYSGGAGSFAAAKMVVDRYGPSDVELLFSDTKVEDPDLYRFLDETSAFLGVPVTRLADGRTIWQVFKDKRFLGNSRVDPCSRILKREICKDYVTRNYTPENCTLYVGIDWMEVHRMKNVLGFWSPFNVVAPLVDDTTYDKDAFIASMAGWGIAMPRLYRLGFPHNNCGGGCVKAGIAHFLHLLRNLPDVYAEWEANEADLREFLGKDVSILRERTKAAKEANGGKARPLTLKELRERSESIAQTEDGQHEWGGCGCFSDIPAEELAEKPSRLAMPLRVAT